MLEWRDQVEQMEGARGGGAVGSSENEAGSGALVQCLVDDGCLVHGQPALQHGAAEAGQGEALPLPLPLPMSLSLALAPALALALALTLTLPLPLPLTTTSTRTVRERVRVRGRGRGLQVGSIKHSAIRQVRQRSTQQPPHAVPVPIAAVPCNLPVHQSELEPGLGVPLGRAQPTAKQFDQCFEEAAA